MTIKKDEPLQKLMAHAGVASRRACESLIASGRVRLNGKIVTEMGTRASSEDKIEVDGKRLVLEKKRTYLFHKPRAMVSTVTDPEGRLSLESIIKELPVRAYPVGRLDFHTSGALLLSNDGDLTQALLHPSSHMPKVYRAKLKGMLSVSDLQQLRTGVVLDDGTKTSSTDVVVESEDAGYTWLQMTLYEGKNRQIHRMCEALGFLVQRLIRVSFGGISIDGIRPGYYRELTRDEIDALKKKVGPQKRVRSKAMGNTADHGFDAEDA